MTDARKENLSELNPSPPLVASEADDPQTPLSLLAIAEGDVGVAAFRRGNQAIFVFDRAIDFGATQIRSDLDRSHVIYQTLGEATTLSIPWPNEAPIQVKRTPVGWAISSEANRRLADTPQPQQEIEGRNLLKAETPGRVVSISDPETGQNLLVGTILSTEIDTQIVTELTRTPEYSLLAAEYGVVVEPLSDAVELKPSAGGFSLNGVQRLAQPSAQNPRAKLLTRKFGFSIAPIPDQLQQLNAEIASAAAKPVRSRAASRLVIAEAELSLGLGAEALAVLNLTAAEDPIAAQSPNLKAFVAIASALADKIPEAGDISAKELDGSDEIELWRGVKKARKSRALEDAAALYRFLPILLSYSEPLRARLLPWIVEAAVKMHVPNAFIDLPVEIKSSEALLFAKGLSFEAAGETQQALGVYAAIDQGGDLKTRVKAMARSAEIKLAAGDLTPAQVCEVLRRQAFIWRGDDLEIQMKMRAVELAAGAGLWRVVFEGLRDVEQSPFLTEVDGLAGLILQKKANAFKDIIAERPTGISSVELVSLSKEFATEIPQGEEGRAFNRQVATKLLQLDLPQEAVSILKPVVEKSTSDLERAQASALLAQALLDTNQAGDVNQILESSSNPALPAWLQQQRTYLTARAKAATGHLGEADLLLAALDTTDANELRARLAVENNDWKRALAAISDIVKKDVAADGILSDANQKLVVRQITAAVRAEDDAAVQKIYTSRLDQMTPPQSQTLKLLAAPVLSGASPLARSRQELASAKAFNAFTKQPLP